MPTLTIGPAATATPSMNRHPSPTNLQQIPESPRYNERDAFSLSLEQRIGGDGGACEDEIVRGQ